MKLPECKFTKFLFVVTGMSYIVDSSGTSKVVQAHEDIFREHGIGYVVIFPISRSSGEGVNWRVKTTGCYAIVIDGLYIGVASANEVLNCLLQLQDAGKTCIGILAHHIIRNNIVEIQWILKKIRNVPVVYYLHDFFTCCTNPNMLKNDTESCIDGGVSCEGCCYAEKRHKHLETIANFLNAFADRITFVAPSEYAKERWLTYYSEYKEHTIVIPHQKNIGDYYGNKVLLPEDAPIRFGFVGAQKKIKGWECFKKAVEQIKASNCYYKIYAFSNGIEKLPEIENVVVDIATQGKDAMIKALRERQIDIVFLGSMSGETYSYTMYESHSANSYIITLQNSGNIAFVTSKENWGSVFRTEDELILALQNEKRMRQILNVWKTTAAPGAAEHVDNDDVMNLFPIDTFGTINWVMKGSNPIKRLKRKLLNKIFITTRLKYGGD